MDSDDTIPISLIAHTVFCPRRAWIEAQGEQVDSFAITAGTMAHKRVDNASESRPGAERAMLIHSEELGLTGRCDVVKEQDDQSLEIVEYKSTPSRRRALITESQRIQVIAQVICLEEMGHRVTGAGVYFTNHHTQIPIIIDDAARQECREWVQSTRNLIGAAQAPKPLLDDPRCVGCSHATVCLPDENRHMEGQKARSISVSDPDGTILHVMTPGARGSLRQGRVTVSKNGEELASVPLEKVCGIVVHGNVDLSSALIREMLWRRLTVVWCSGRGRVIGWASSADSPNGQARVHQHVMSELGSLPIAQQIIRAKIGNQATMIRRNGDRPDLVTELRALARATETMPSLPEVFALEGRAAQIYFSGLPSMLKGAEARAFLNTWPGRHGRGATDPLNAAMNFTYSLLLSDCIRALAACGLDPHAGFLHSPSRNKPALALDLMEEFRAPIADSVVLTCINNGALTTDMFSHTLGDSRLSTQGRNAIVSAYERRVTTEISHPSFGYTVSWRRAIEVQARIILGVVDGTRNEYKGMTVR
ncbi:CRISPR-associated endonuclease Cas1 [Acidipropionibacterium virtanenii]|uniref:CRISPR-associated endonuclease Cas1 n=1 Tax=Acidipropionibacterium virtanenii TaxID=2057246 RepID=A0A344UQZ8_9ACTN|nr:CRISPR-associated endonuclease Cas1 [Acidipropionibacterium virtanenii]AXE37696.1 CRISPR-associated exonuclease Cas4/endonuclease Cas1 fusion [Acidipropionibacterium virtanenii]